MKGLILGAGYGVRLYPLTKNTPKPLLPIAGRPVIEWTLDHLMAIPELDEIYVVVNQQFYENYQRWLNNYQKTGHKKKIILCNDGTTSNDNRLGAVGDIQLVIKQQNIHDDLLIIAGDNLFDFNLKEFVKFQKTHGSVIGLKNMIGLDKTLISQYSVVTLDEKKQQVINFEEKPPLPQSTLIAICLYIFAAKELGALEEYIEQGFNKDAPGYYIQWLYKKITLYGYALKGSWFDIGDIDSYKKADDYYLKSNKKAK
jgi:glucose-1-phosphate thymidylyltransferase